MLTRGVARQQAHTVPTLSSSPVPACAVRFRKVLYERQPFPDDHTDESFLSELVLNLNVRRRSYWVLVHGSVAVTQQLSVVAVTALVFAAVRSGGLTPSHLLRLDGTRARVASTPERALPSTCESHPLTRSAAALLLLGVCVRCLLRGARGAVQATREAAVLLAGVYLLSPLLQTLTGTVSGDSVSAMVVASLLAHLYLHDYHFGRDVAHTLQGSLSLAAALFASVLLASRLDSPQAVFALLCCALQAFVAWPFLRRDILGASPAAHVALTAALHVGTCGALGKVSGVLAGAHASLLIFITFVCPWSLVQCHGIKQRINGCERLQT